MQGPRSSFASRTDELGQRALREQRAMLAVDMNVSSSSFPFAGVGCRSMFGLVAGLSCASTPKHEAFEMGKRSCGSDHVGTVDVFRCPFLVLS